MTHPPQKACVLIVDDELSHREDIAETLRVSGYDSRQAGSTAEMFELLNKEQNIDLVTLDIDMPVENGYTACSRLRQSHPGIPILMLSGFTGEYNKVVSLELGADDYLTKPFGKAELVARVKALLRRTALRGSSTHFMEANFTPSKYQFAGYIFDAKLRRLIRADGEEIRLSDNEIELLKIFIEHAGDVLSREKLIELSRNQSALPFDRRIDIIIHRLRKKLEENPDSPAIIKTIRNKGYMFVAPVSSLS